MSVIIAVLLIVYVLCRVLNDKSKSAAYDRQRNIEKAAITNWESLYVDESLEATLQRCISEEGNYEAVRQEVGAALASTKHWRHIVDNGFVLNNENKEIALDIMLANRGKVSSHASYFGYAAYILHGNDLLKESRYEYAELLLNLLHSHGANLNLLYKTRVGSDYYVWEGSFGGQPPYNSNASHEVVKPFDRKLIEKTVTPIPPIKCKRQTYRRKSV